MMNMLNPYEMESRFDLPISEISSDMILQFHGYWLQISGSGRLPARADIDPANFKRFLPNVILTDIEQDPFRVRYRLCGTKVAEFCGNLTGRYLDEVATTDVWSAAAYLRQYEIAGDRRPAGVQFRHDGGPVRRPPSVPDRICRWPAMAGRSTPASRSRTT